MTLYLSTAIYDRLVAVLLNPEPDPFSGKPGADSIRIILGEVADIWPVSILPDAIASGEFGETWST